MNQGKTKAEKREQKKRNMRKMKISGRSVKKLRTLQTKKH
jgi:hypothetical protein